jgi:quercetin dioxygenase-like cupin family protein
MTTRYRTHKGRVRAADWRVSTPYPGLARVVLAHSERIMLVRHEMARGSVFPRHSHPHEQLAFVLSGKIRVRCGDDQFDASAGDSFVVAGGVEHEVHALDSSVVLDAFTPCRDDYLSTSGDSLVDRPRDV